MIGFLRGTVSQLLAEYCFLEVQGVGYRVFITAATRQKLATGKTVQLFTHMHVREDAILLYGFYTQDEYEVFLTLMSINGIGPKVALGILSAIEPQQFRVAISTKNLGILTKLPGVGKKTAERLILELKDKIGAVDVEGLEEEPLGAPAGSDLVGETIQALTALGYSQQEIMPVVKRLGKQAQSVEALIKLSLRELSRG